MKSSTEYLKRAYDLKDAADAQNFYDEWAAQYDTDMDELGYRLPALVAEAVPRHVGVKGTILDAGCGTGLVGQALLQLGASTVDGLDISTGMLEKAKHTGAYRKLEVADLTKVLPVADATYDAVVCSGTLTHGHVGPSALPEFARVTQAGGLIAASIIDDIWVTKGYKSEVNRLVDEGVVSVVSVDEVEFRKERNVYVRLVILRKL